MVTNRTKPLDKPSLPEAPRAIVNKGRNLGELAAGALVKWAEQEQETDALMHRWERALDAQSRGNDLNLNPASLLPTIPEGFEFEYFQSPTNPDDQTHMEDEDDVKAHVLGNKWRNVKDEAERLFDRNRGHLYYSLASELRR